MACHKESHKTVELGSRASRSKCPPAAFCSCTEFKRLSWQCESKRLVSAHREAAATVHLLSLRVSQLGRHTQGHLVEECRVIRDSKVSLHEDLFSEKTPIWFNELTRFPRNVRIIHSIFGCTSRADVCDTYALIHYRLHDWRQQPRSLKKPCMAIRLLAPRQWIAWKSPINSNSRLSSAILAARIATHRVVAGRCPLGGKLACTLELMAARQPLST